jgi:DNA-binding beta-propeller fold protein YncE
MKVLTVVLPAAAIALASGCSAGSAQQAAPGSHGPSSAAAAGVTSSPAAIRVTRAHAVPGCTTATAPARALGAAGTSLEAVPGNPFGVVAASSGGWSFVSLINSVAVLRSGGQAAPSLIRTIPVPGHGALGAALTRDGRYLVVADDSGAEVIDVARAENGSPHAVLGSLASTRGGGAIEVALAADDRYAFVSLEGSQEIAVFSLQRALADGFGPSDFIGDIPAGLAPVGLAVSPDGQWLYATSELKAPSRGGGGGGGLGGQGTLQVISIRRAETDPGRSVVATVSAGCQPVRVITSADGSVVWVTARASDTLLGFSAAMLRAHPARSLVGAVRVGAAPVGLALVSNGARIVVADSNRFSARGATSSLAVVNVAAALAGKPALLGYLRAGGFPRQMALEPGGATLLVTNFNSRQLESVNVADLP